MGHTYANMFSLLYSMVEVCREYGTYEYMHAPSLTEYSIAGVWREYHWRIVAVWR